MKADQLMLICENHFAKGPIEFRGVHHSANAAAYDFRFSFQDKHLAFMLSYHLVAKLNTKELLNQIDMMLTPLKKLTQTYENQETIKDLLKVKR